MNRRSAMTRRLLATTVPIGALCAAGLALAEPTTGILLNQYGLPGAIDTPSAEMLPDATLGATLSYSKLSQKTGLTFQLAPQITTALRYSKFDSTDDSRGYIRDRSFDVRVQLLSEDPQGWRPAIAVGLQDFMGTGYYSSEYIVATKTLTPRLRASAGLGWGRLAQSGSIGAPFGDRPKPDEGNGGRVNSSQWFKGDVAPFANVAWSATDKLTLLAEYSGDSYACETNQADSCPRKVWLADDKKLKNNINLGLSYQAMPNVQVAGYLLGGNTAGFRVSMTMNPRQAPYPSGLEKAPTPVRPRPSPQADPDGWSGAWTAEPTAHPVIQKALADAMKKDGQELESMSLSRDTAEVRFRNHRYIQHAQAIGRTARLMTRALPPSVETLVITSVESGVPVSSVTLRRSDVERLENTDAGQIAAVAVMSDARPNPGLVPTPGVFPKFQWAIKPYMATGLFDPDQPVRFNVGGELTARYELLPGLVASGSIRQRLAGNMDQKAPGDYTVDAYDAMSIDQITAENNGVPRVRSDGRMYSGNKRPTIPQLTLAWYAKPTDQVYTRVTVGLLESMYGGISAEALWKPAESRLALGAEINRVKKRDFRDAFGFRDYEVTTGHVSAYYEFGGGFVGQVDAGRYLAGDNGATVKLTREFANGWRVGAYATKTNMSSEKFGEGSFDKGVTFSIPLAWGTGQPSLRRVGGDLNSLSRDGGQRVNVSGRLYDSIRESQSTQVYDGWGRFWR